MLVKGLWRRTVILVTRDLAVETAETVLGCHTHPKSVQLTLRLEHCHQNSHHVVGERGALSPGLAQRDGHRRTWSIVPPADLTEGLLEGCKTEDRLQHLWRNRGHVAYRSR